MNDYLNRFKNEKKNKISILMRGSSEEEMNVYKNYGFKDSKLMERNNNNPWQTYDVINKSKLTIGFTTSCVQKLSQWEKGLNL